MPASGIGLLGDGSEWTLLLLLLQKSSLVQGLPKLGCPTHFEKSARLSAASRVKMLLDGRFRIHLKANLKSSFPHGPFRHFAF